MTWHHKAGIEISTGPLSCGQWFCYQASITFFTVAQLACLILKPPSQSLQWYTSNFKCWMNGNKYLWMNTECGEEDAAEYNRNEYQKSLVIFAFCMRASYISIVWLGQLNSYITLVQWVSRSELFTTPIRYHKIIPRYASVTPREKWSQS